MPPFAYDEQEKKSSDIPVEVCSLLCTFPERLDLREACCEGDARLWELLAPAPLPVAYRILAGGSCSGKPEAPAPVPVPAWARARGPTGSNVSRVCCFLGAMVVRLVDKQSTITERSVLGADRQGMHQRVLATIIDDVNKKSRISGMVVN